MNNLVITILFLLIPSIFSNICNATNVSQAISEKEATPKKPNEKYAIDGFVNFNDFSYNTSVLTFYPNRIPTRVRWIVENDDKHLYVAVEWQDKTHNNSRAEFYSQFDALQFYLTRSKNSDDTTSADFRQIKALHHGSRFIDGDARVRQDPFGPIQLLALANDKIGDGLAKMTYNQSNQTYQAEYLLPLRNDALGQDVNIRKETKFQIELVDANQNRAYLFKDVWQNIPLKKVQKLPRPEAPTDLTGIIAFVSVHENPKGDIYTFNPRTQVVTRVTDSPDLVKSCVSISYDRETLAFHGGRGFDSVENILTMEIYTVNVDGTNMRKITDDPDVANLHPAWSPDGNKIMYTPVFINRSPPPGKSPKGVSVMTRDGVFLQALTPSGIAEHDAEYLPDGRIVAKTNRWSTSPFEYEDKIVVFDEHPDAARHQLTFGTGFTDHDPEFGPGDTTIFERFTGNFDYAHDLELATVTPWDLVETRNDASGETTLLADGWMNHLPVYDPSGEFILYMRGPDYTEVKLMSREGVNYGRFIPNITQVNYIDWR